MDHSHPAGEYCAQCEPALSADYGKGEQFWRHWSTRDYIAFPIGRKARIKILSKRGHTEPYRFQAVCLCAFEDGSQALMGEAYFGSDEELLKFVLGIQFVLYALFPEHSVLNAIDFRDCMTLEKWEYRMREETTKFRVYNDPKDHPGREEEAGGEVGRPDA